MLEKLSVFWRFLYNFNFVVVDVNMQTNTQTDEQKYKQMMPGLSPTDVITWSIR